MELEPLTLIGERSIAGYPATVFGMEQEDRFFHSALIGRTGMGKSGLLQTLAVQDFQREGVGVCVIDPHGDLVEELVHHIPPWRSDDVVYFDATDFENPVALDLLRTESEEDGHLVVSAVVSALKHVWGDFSWGPRLEYILAMALSVVVGRRDTSLLGVLRLLSDEKYRELMVRGVKDPVVRAFWQHEFGNYSKRFRVEAISPLQNKLGRLLLSAPLRNILGQTRGRWSVEHVVSNHGILLVNLSRGELGEDKSSLLGALFVAQLQLAAMRRAAVPEGERRPFHLLVDEFPSLASDSFADMLSELRKFKMSVTLSAQFLAQARPRVRSSILGNCGSLFCFGCGVEDAEILAPYFDPYPASELVDLSPYQVFVRMMREGELRAPFKGQTLPPLRNDFGRAELLKKLSRERFSTPRAVVEDKIERWLG